MNIKIAFAPDDNYVLPTICAMQSIMSQANMQDKYTFYILNNNISNYYLEIIKTYCKKMNVSLFFIDINTYLNGIILNTQSYVTAATYYRLILPYIVDTDKILYLDSDVIVKSDIAELYKEDISNHCIGAIRDYVMISQVVDRDHVVSQYEYFKKVGLLNKIYDYFNAGVLLLNNEKIRNNITIEKMFSMMHNKNFMFADQDILNLLFQSHCKKLPQYWNVMTYHTEKRDLPTELIQEIEKATNNPRLIHYNGRNKPWKNFIEGSNEDFWKEAKKTKYFYELLGRIEC